LLRLGNSIVLSVPPEQVCRFNPCEKSACFTSQAERCAVSYKCKPIFFGADGQRLNCRGIEGINSEWNAFLSLKLWFYLNKSGFQLSVESNQAITFVLRFGFITV